MTVPQGLGIGVTLSQTNLLKYSQYQKSCNDNNCAYDYAEKHNLGAIFIF